MRRKKNTNVGYSKPSGETQHSRILKCLYGILMLPQLLSIITSLHIHYKWICKTWQQSFIVETILYIHFCNFILHFPQHLFIAS